MQATCMDPMDSVFNLDEDKKKKHIRTCVCVLQVFLYFVHIQLNIFILCRM